MVGSAIQDGNQRVALALLKGLGLLPGTQPQIGPTTARQIARQQHEAAMIRSLGL